MLWCLSLRELRYRASYISFHYVIPTTPKLFLFSSANSFNLSSIFVARQRQERKDTKHTSTYLTVSSWQRNVPNLGDPEWGGPVAWILQKLMSPWIPKLTVIYASETELNISEFLHKILQYLGQSRSAFPKICSVDHSPLEMFFGAGGIKSLWSNNFRKQKTIILWCSLVYGSFENACNKETCFCLM